MDREEVEEHVTKIENVVLLTVDALRADHVSYYGYSRNTTPGIDAIADEFVAFRQVYSASSHTREALPALLTGTHTDMFSDSGYRLVGPSVADRLSEASFETAAFHSNPFASRAYGFDSGFDVFDDDLYVGRSRLIALAQRLLDKIRNRHYARATEINERAIEWIDNLDGDGGFFLWNHYMDVHGPYQPPFEHRSKFVDGGPSAREAQQLYNRAVDDPESISDAEAELMHDLYDSEIRYCDDHLTNFLEDLKDEDLLANTLILITADHGDAFGEHGYFGHPRRLDEELLKVPLVVRGPGIPSVDVDVPVSTLDVMPTVLTAADLSVDSLSGVPLQQVWADPSAYVDRTVFSQVLGEDEEASSCRFIANGTDGRAVLEADVSTGELSQGEVTDQSLVSTLESYAAERLEGLTVRESDEGVDNAEIKERLEALGYRK